MWNIRALVCDDEEQSLLLLSRMLGAEGMTVETFATGQMLIDRLTSGRNGDADILLLDVRLPDKNGIQILQEVKRLRPGLQVIMMTAYGSIDSAVKAMRLGAFDFLTKPFPRAKLLVCLRNALETELLRKENRELRIQTQQLGHADAIVFQSALFREIHDLALKVADSNANIVILGESGTGKELIARLIHRQSPRRQRPFLSINCASFSESLLESQLFGHARGAFTDAVTTHRGFLEDADGGTLFLDEIADMAPAVQAKVLRAIQEGEFYPIGSNRPCKVDVRFVAATNRDLLLEVASGRFREDLYYRLSVIMLKLPPLRERLEDIEPLAEYYLRLFNSQMKKGVTGISTEARDLLASYAWPGNVRELKNIIERAVILTETYRITPDTLPLNLVIGQSDSTATVGNLETSLEQLEREHISRVLRGTGGHKSRTAQILGVTRRTLDRKIAEFGLDYRQKRHRGGSGSTEGEITRCK